MTAELLPFPIVRRRELVDRIAAQMLARPADVAEKHLRAQIRCQAAAMRRRQIAEPLIAEQTRGFEAAVRAALWRQVLMPDGAA